MKKLIGVLCACLLLPLSALSDPLVIYSSGRGPSEVAAISAAKKQAATDAQLAGFLPLDGYRIGNIQLLEIKHVGAIYVARLASELTRDSESNRFVFVVSGHEAQRQELLSLVQRVRSALSERRFNFLPPIEVIDEIATGALRFSSPADLQYTGIEAELDQIVRKHHADALYLLSANNENSSVFLITLKTASGPVKTIRKLGDRASENSVSLASQVVDAIRQDFDSTDRPPPGHSIVTLPSWGGPVKKGQSVAIYIEKIDDSGVLESSIITRGIVTEISGTKVRVLTEQPVPSSLSGRLRFTPLSKRGILITESDW